MPRRGKRIVPVAGTNTAGRFRTRTREGSVMTISEIGHAPSTNGDLVNRVQQLRINDTVGATVMRSRGAWLPWVLCGLLAVTWAGVGVRFYKTASSESSRE